MPVPEGGFADRYPDHDPDQYPEQYQDPALARALRDLPTPAPAVPRWSPAEVRQRGVRRRNRRHAAWGGAGVIAAALVGVLIAGPLTPERGPTGAAGPQQVQAADPGTSRGTPGPGSDGAPSASPSAARIDIGNLELTIYDDSGRPSGDMLNAVANDAAVDTLTGPTHLEVIARYETKAFEVAANAGGSDLSLPWVVELSNGNGQLLYVTSPDSCPDDGCNDHLANQTAVIGVFTPDLARKFYDSVEQGDAVDVVGYWGGGNSTVPPSSTPAQESSPPAKSAPARPGVRTSTPAKTVEG